jgi:beta-aspartyl-peptidase (threonine type)
MATIAIHGGAGTIPRGSFTPETYQAAREGLRQALLAGWAVLKDGGLALDAVEAAVISLENCPSFNAGHGAVLNTNGVHELDAGIMDGRDLAAGCIASAKTIKNPIIAARKVMENTDCVLLSAEGADAFAKEAGLETVEQSYYTTEMRVQNLQRAKDEEKGLLVRPRSEAEKHGTVGAVAHDDSGNVASATSTGGYTNKRAGRVGDTPVIGAGTYARNGVCAISCTGTGEYFIRNMTAHDIAAKIQYAGVKGSDAAQQCLDVLTAQGCSGGLIMVDGQGDVTMPYNSEGMYRGMIDADGNLWVGIHADDFRIEEKLTK